MYHCKADNLSFKISTETLPEMVYSMVKCTEKLISLIRIFKPLLEIMFFNAFFLTVPSELEIDTSVLYKMKADFPSFNLVIKKHKYFI